MRVRRNGSAQPTPHFGILLALIMGGTIVGVVRMAQQANHWGPNVGDIVSFGSAPSGLSPRVTLGAKRLGPAGTPEACQLDSHVMKTMGGSLVVEASQPGGAYRARWAGGATASGAANCGARAELLLTGSDIAALASSAGGFGVHH